jgi:hypothetical protein
VSNRSALSGALNSALLKLLQAREAGERPRHPKKNMSDSSKKKPTKKKHRSGGFFVTRWRKINRYFFVTARTAGLPANFQK